MVKLSYMWSYTEGTIWHTQGSTTILETTIQEAGIMGIRNQPVRLVRRKQDD